MAHPFRKLENTTRWTGGSQIKVDAAVLADVFSTSGETFLDKRADALETVINWWLDLHWMKVAQLRCRPY